MGKLAIAFALCVGSACSATPDEAAIENTFVKPWVEALRSKDQARMEQFLHPAVRACINPATKEFFDRALQINMHSQASGPYLITKIEPMRQPAPTFLPEEDVKYPVQPTYEVNIEFEQSATVHVRFLAPSNGSWFEVFPCPNEKGIAFMHAQLAEGAKQEKEAARRLAELKDPLRGELKDLLKRQQKIDAIHKYQAAAGVDLTTAVGVINALQESSR